MKNTIEDIYRMNFGYGFKDWGGVVYYINAVAEFNLFKKMIGLRYVFLTLPPTCPFLAVFLLAMVYYVIGLMSGSSLDGLDIAYVQLTEVRDQWSYEIVESACMPYPDEWVEKLSQAASLNAPELFRLHTSYGHYVGNAVAQFIEHNQLQHRLHFVASHGHTVWHEPETRTTVQIGDGAAIAAILQVPVISDLRNVDVALGGQGAPIVPVADRYLFSEYDFCLNIGGIANITINHEQPIAFDICPANQLLNHFAQQTGLPYDRDGAVAETGQVIMEVLEAAGRSSFYQTDPPKSLDNRFAQEILIPLFQQQNAADHLRTSVQHIAEQIKRAIKPYLHAGKQQQMLVTGGGALNKFLITKIQEELGEECLVIVPEENTVLYKEALAMALIGTLRWREEINIWNSVTGAARSSIGGAIWLS